MSTANAVQDHLANYPEDSTVIWTTASITKHVAGNHDAAMFFRKVLYHLNTHPEQAEWIKDLCTVHVDSHKRVHLLLDRVVNSITNNPGEATRLIDVSTPALQRLEDIASMDRDECKRNKHSFHQYKCDVRRRQGDGGCGLTTNFTCATGSRVGTEYCEETANGGCVLNRAARADKQRLFSRRRVQEATQQARDVYRGQHS